MDKEFVSYEIAETMKSLGYDEPCLAMYSDEVLEMWLQDQYDFRSIGEESGFQFKNSMWDDSRFVAAPLLQQAFNWFLDNYGIFAETTFWGDGIGYVSSIKEIRQENFREVYNLGLATPNRGLPNWDKNLEDLACLNKIVEIITTKGDLDKGNWRVLINPIEREDFLLSVSSVLPDQNNDTAGEPYSETYNTEYGTYEVIWETDNEQPIVRKFIG
jgi:hypothetical protein